jgi:hypothetical protein
MFIAVLSPTFTGSCYLGLILLIITKLRWEVEGNFSGSVDLFAEGEGIFRPWNINFVAYASFLAELRIAFTVVPQTTHWPFKAGLPFFMVTR